MDEMSSVVSLTLRLGDSIKDSVIIGTQVEITGLKLVTETAIMLPTNSVLGITTNDYNKNENSIVVTDLMIQESEDDDMISVGDETIAITGDELLALNVATHITLPASLEIVNVGDGQIAAKAIILEDSSIEHVPVSMDVEMSNVSAVKSPPIVLQLPHEKILGGGIKSVFEFDCVPLWGSVSVCGRRPEMEDAIASVPRLLKIPIKMLIGDRVIDGLSQSLTHQTTHFFGVYDGHGGFQVANYCRDRIHCALVEEITNIEDSMIDGLIGENWQVQWEKAFTKCFEKVDDEIAGKSSTSTSTVAGNTCDVTSEPIASETVGSTAVAALICSSHIIVANCGDSRAVLCRGKEAIALSVDHKPNREDEYARIEASGGKVIQWNGYRVLGVLAMSRSIGDRYLKPWIIPEPEVMFVPRAREDECLVIASDGLWDVMSNEEACEAARKRILLWHKKNGTTITPLLERGKDIDPAAQAAAEYLSMLAMKRGSKDNISVIVVDLKAGRKFKTKPKS